MFSRTYSDVRYYDSHNHSICADSCPEVRNLELDPSSLIGRGGSDLFIFFLMTAKTENNCTKRYYLCSILSNKLNISFGYKTVLVLRTILLLRLKYFL